MSEGYLRRTPSEGIPSRPYTIRRKHGLDLVQQAHVAAFSFLGLNPNHEQYNCPAQVLGSELVSWSAMETQQHHHHHHHHHYADSEAFERGCSAPFPPPPAPATVSQIPAFKQTSFVYGSQKAHGKPDERSTKQNTPNRISWRKHADPCQKYDHISTGFETRLSSLYSEREQQSSVVIDDDGDGEEKGGKFLNREEGWAAHTSVSFNSDCKLKAAKFSHSSEGHWHYKRIQSEKAAKEFTLEVEETMSKKSRSLQVLSTHDKSSDMIAKNVVDWVSHHSSSSSSSSSDGLNYDKNSLSSYTVGSHDDVEYSHGNIPMDSSNIAAHIHVESEKSLQNMGVLGQSVYSKQNGSSMAGSFDVLIPHNGYKHGGMKTVCVHVEKRSLSQNDSKLDCKECCDCQKSVPIKLSATCQENCQGKEGLVLQMTVDLVKKRNGNIGFFSDGVKEEDMLHEKIITLDVSESREDNLHRFSHGAQSNHDLCNSISDRKNTTNDNGDEKNVSSDTSNELRHRYHQYQTELVREKSCLPVTASKAPNLNLKGLTKMNRIRAENQFSSRHDLIDEESCMTEKRMRNDPIITNQIERPLSEEQSRSVRDTFHENRWKEMPDGINVGPCDAFGEDSNQSKNLEQLNRDKKSPSSVNQSLYSSQRQSFTQTEPIIHFKSKEKIPQSKQEQSVTVGTKQAMAKETLESNTDFSLDRILEDEITGSSSNKQHSSFSLKEEFRQAWKRQHNSAKDVQLASLHLDPSSESFSNAQKEEWMRLSEARLAAEEKARIFEASAEAAEGRLLSLIDERAKLHSKFEEEIKHNETDMARLQHLLKQEKTKYAQSQKELVETRQRFQRVLNDNPLKSYGDYRKGSNEAIFCDSVSAASNTELHKGEGNSYNLESLMEKDAKYSCFEVLNSAEFAKTGNDPSTQNIKGDEFFAHQADQNSIIRRNSAKETPQDFVKRMQGDEEPKVAEKAIQTRSFKEVVLENYNYVYQCPIFDLDEFEDCFNSNDGGFPLFLKHAQNQILQEGIRVNENESGKECNFVDDKARDENILGHQCNNLADTKNSENILKQIRWLGQQRASDPAFAKKCLSELQNYYESLLESMKSQLKDSKKDVETLKEACTELQTKLSLSENEAQEAKTISELRETQLRDLRRNLEVVCSDKDIALEKEKEESAARLQDAIMEAEKLRQSVREYLSINEELLEFSQQKENEVVSLNQNLIIMQKQLQDRTNERNRLTTELEESRISMKMMEDIQKDMKEKEKEKEKGHLPLLNQTDGNTQLSRELEDTWRKMADLKNQYTHLESEHEIAVSKLSERNLQLAQQEATIGKLKKQIEDIMEGRDSMLEEYLQNVKYREFELRNEIRESKAMAMNMEEKNTSVEAELGKTRLELAETRKQVASMRKMVEQKEEQFVDMKQATDSLRKKVLDLEEEMMEKEGQIAILRSSFPGDCESNY